MERNMDELLEVQNLGVRFDTDRGIVEAVRDAGFSVNRGEIFGIVGESGSGKSVSMKAVMRILPENASVTHGIIRFDGKDLGSLSEKEFRPYLGKRMAMIFQDSLTALNPVYTVGSKMNELIRYMDKTPKKEAREKALRLFGQVGIRDPERCYRSYPHELSGGMRQRIMIAMALSCSPDLIIADEPTTSLDVTIQAQILRLLKDIQQENGLSLILITHDLGVVAQMCSRVAVICGGYTVETGSVRDIFHSPRHPYTKALVASMPKTGVKFEPFLEKPTGAAPEGICPFCDRCPAKRPECEKELPGVISCKEGHTVRCFSERSAADKKESVI